MTSVPIHTNPETRPSRLFSSMWRYMKRSSSVITRSFLMYRPLKFFSTIGIVLLLLGLILGIRFLVYFCIGDGDGHIQSLILTAVLLMTGFRPFPLASSAMSLLQTVKFWRTCSIVSERQTARIKKMMKSIHEIKNSRVLYITTKNTDYLRVTQEVRLLQEAGNTVTLIGSSERATASGCVPSIVRCCLSAWRTTISAWWDLHRSWCCRCSGGNYRKSRWSSTFYFVLRYTLYGSEEVPSAVHPR